MGKRQTLFGIDDITDVIGKLFKSAFGLRGLYNNVSRTPDKLGAETYLSLTATDLCAALQKTKWFETLIPTSKDIFRSVFIGCIEDPINHQINPFAPIKPEEYEQYILRAVTSVILAEERDVHSAGRITDITLKDLNKQFLSIRSLEAKEMYTELFLHPEAAQQISDEFTHDKGSASSNTEPLI
ncbi:MAG: hypothetical protein DHS20C02_09080 [Micavibrio sp.]|nr:MAG: hypothetical protein DHS20C02_09080 [Micavibrio sp.]